MLTGEQIDALIDAWSTIVETCQELAEAIIDAWNAIVAAVNDFAVTLTPAHRWYLVRRVRYAVLPVTGRRRILRA